MYWAAGFDLLFPGQAMYQTWLRLLPGFTWLTWPSFFLGLVESFAYGWYVALVFGLLQFVSTFGIAWLYSRHANKALDPLAGKLKREYDEGVHK